MTGTGELVLRPQYATISGTPYAVGDLNGDGSSDIVGFLGSIDFIGSGIQATDTLVAFDGRTGNQLWTRPLSLAPHGSWVASGRLTTRPGDDLYVNQGDGHGLTISGASGATMWTH